MRESNQRTPSLTCGILISSGGRPVPRCTTNPDLVATALELRSALKALQNDGVCGAAVLVP